MYQQICKAKEQREGVIPAVRRLLLKEIRKSESAVLYFAQMAGNGRVVLKELRPRQDTRVELASRASRQACQIKGLYWNSRFTSEVYLGLVPLLGRKGDQILIGEETILCGEAPLARLEPSIEYALLMRALPDEQRLDNVLRTAPAELLPLLLERLVRRIVDMHTSLVPPPDEEARFDASGVAHGSYEQVKQKLQHNLAFLDEIIARDGRRYRGVCHDLRKGLLWLINEPAYRCYFASRLDRRQIKRCHGDLKTPNIWIDSERGQEADYGIKILDAIDFNDQYCYIDVLSDFAMLVIDVEFCTRSETLVDTMIERYLQLTGQDDQPSRRVLNYYLIEKAMINGIVNILYDRQPAPGLDFLRLAKQRLDRLVMALPAASP